MDLKHEDTASMNYRQRPGTVDHGREYEHRITALLCLRCIQQNVEDMWVAANVDVQSVFDDLILHIKTKDNEERTFMIQLKHKEITKLVSDREFVKRKGDFSLSKYLRSIEQLHSIMQSQSQDSTLLKNISSFQDIYFVLFTNTGIDDTSTYFTKSKSATLSSFLNTSINTRYAYKFNSTNLSQVSHSDDMLDSYNFYFLPNQVHVRMVDEQIKMEIRKIAEVTGFSTDNVAIVAENFSKYIYKWSRNNFSNFCLTKKDVLSVLTEVLLKEYMLGLEKLTVNNYQAKKYIIWKKIIGDQIVTIIHTDDLVENFLISYINSEVDEYCKGKPNYKQYPDLKFELAKTVSSHRKIHPTDIYTCLWKTKRVPLLLNVRNCRDYENIFKILKLSNYGYKIIIITNNVELPLIQKNEGQYFESLLDLNEEHLSTILMQEILIQGRQGAVLKDVIDKDMFCNIKCSHILHILSGHFNIGRSLKSLPEYFIQRSITTKFIKTEILEKHDAFFIINECSEHIFDIMSKYNCKTYKLQDIDFDNLLSISGIVETEGDINSNQLKNLISTGKSVHIVSVHDSNYFEWKWSYGSTEIIEKFQVDKEYALEKSLINNLNSTNILIGDPGSGKSVLIDYLAHQLPFNKWILKINLYNHQSYWKESRKVSNMEVSQHLLYFYDQLEYDTQSETQLARSVFKKYVALKNVIVFLDGFDEVSPHQATVKDFARTLLDEGFQVFITSRPSLKTYLENAFTSKSFEMKPFTAEEQVQFLIKYFVAGNPTVKRYVIEKFATLLLQVTRGNLNSSEGNFAEKPVQILLLAEAFRNQFKNYVERENFEISTDFAVLDLYQTFMDSKIDLLKEHYGYHQSIDLLKEDYEHHLSLFALSSVFSPNIFKKWDILQKTYDFYKQEPGKKLLLQYSGIMTVDDDFKVKFIHSTYADYLSAKWLSQNVYSSDQQTKEIALSLTKERFAQKHKVLFNIFDRFLCKDCPLHLAVLDKQLDKIKELVLLDTERVDLGGRSPLHIIALNSFHYPLPYNAHMCKMLPNTDTIVELQITKLLLDTQAIIDTTDLMGYSALDYALANCSLLTANEICKKITKPMINIYINLHYKSDYFLYCNNHYPELFQLLLPYFASRDLLLGNVQGDTDIYSYTNGLCNTYEGQTLLQLLQSENGCQYSGCIRTNNSICYTDLRFAIAEGLNTVAENLLSKTFDVNRPDMDECVPLHYAVLHKRAAIVEILLDKGAEINKPNYEDNTPLHLAILKRDRTIIKLLLSKGAQLNISNAHGNTALHLITQDCDYNIPKEILFKLFKTIEEIIHHTGANINSKNSRGETALFQAVKKKSKNIIYALLRNGANIDEQNNHGNTVLHWTSARGFVDMSELICSEGANVNVSNRKGETPLHIASVKGYKDILLILIAYAADIKLRDNNGDTSLHLASKKGRLAAVKLLVAKGADVKAENNAKNTPLHLSSQNRHTSTTDFLLKRGAPINAVNLNGDTALHLAVANGDKLVKLLISNKAHVHLQNDNGETPLHLASSNGFTNIVELLVRCPQVDLYTSNRNGDTSLHLASQNGHTEIVNLLLNRGMYIDIENIEGNTPLHAAVSKGHMNVVKLLSAMGAKTSVRKKDGTTPLHLAVQNSHADIVKYYFISEGADIESSDIEGNTPLHWASKIGCINTVQLLVALGANVNANNMYGNTSLHLACMEGYADVAVFLASSNADVNAKNINGDTSLHLASLKGYNEIALLLVNKGTDIMARNVNGETPLHIASKEGHLNIVSLLIKNGADWNSANWNGDTSFHLASQNGHQDIITLLLDYKVDINSSNEHDDTPLHLACRHNHIEIIRHLLKYGVDVNRQNMHGKTPLHVAIENHDEDLIQLLMNHGANADVLDKKYLTPLHYAASSNNFSIIKYLISRDAHVQEPDFSGNTVLHIASQYGSTKIIDLLLNKSADINVQNKAGITALHLAAMNDSSDVIKFLIEKGADIHISDDNSNTPLTLAISNCNMEIISLLLEKDSHIANKKALQLAIQKRDQEPLKLLLRTIIENGNGDKRKLPNFRFPIEKELAEDCPFHLAIINGNLEQAKDLIDSDSNSLKMVDQAGRSVLHILANYGVQHYCLTVMDYKNLQKPVKDTAADFVAEVIESLGIDFQFNDILGYNPLDYALSHDSLAVADKICEKLINLPINIDLQNKKMYFTCCGVYEYKHLFTTLVKYFASRFILCKGLNPTMNSFVVKDCENAIFLISNGKPKIISSFSTNLQIIRQYVKNSNAKDILDLFKFKNDEDTYYDDLRFAVSFGTKENVEKLLSQNWEVNGYDVDKNTALHYAASYNSLVCILDLLIQNGADRNRQGKYGNTPLHCAVKGSHPDFVVALIMNGAEIDSRNKFGETPLHIAARNGLSNITKILLGNKADVDVKDEYGRTALHYAADRNHHDIIELLVNAGASVNQCDNAENTALIYAARNCNEENLALIISKEVDLMKQGFLGRTALHWATYNNSYFMVLLLLKNMTGNGINAKDDFGNTALHYAVRMCHKDIFYKLLFNGASMGIQNNQKETILHCACSRNLLNDDEDEDHINTFNALEHEEIVKTLLLDINTNAVDCYGNTALHCAIITLHKIKQYFGNNSEYIEDCKNAIECYQSIIASLSAITNVNIRNNDKCTVLHLAIKNGDLETAKLVLSNNSTSLNIVDDDGNLPLHLAAREGYNVIVSEILLKSKNVNVKNNDGCTPLDLASNNNHFETMQLMQSF